MLDWDKIRIFHAVAEAGSFTHAGAALNLSQSAISRQISALEERMGAPLFHRHARGLILTEQGEILYQSAHEVQAKIAMAEAMVTDAKDHPRGELKITTPVAFGTIWLAPRIKDFIDLYPDVTISLLLDDRELDLSMRQADVALRLRKPVQPDLVHRKLLTVHNHIYAAPDYLKRFGTPLSIDDIDRHRLIVYGEEAPAPLADINWLVEAAADRTKLRRPTLKVNNVYAVKQAVESGLGIAALPDYIVQANPNIVRILPDIEGPAFDTYFVYPEELRHSKRLAVFRDYLLRQVAEWHY